MNFKHPKIRFALNPKLDTKLAWEFYVDPLRGGYHFWNKQAVAWHPILESLPRQAKPKRFLEDFIVDYYHCHAPKPRLKQLEKLWQKRQKDFFKFTDKTFPSHPWPKGKYIGYLSIFGFGPRFLKNKTFQVPYRQPDKEILFTITHELLHFMFYDYCQKKYPQVFKKLDPETGRFWDLAEIFNVVMHKSKDLQKIHGRVKKAGYPAHQITIKKAQAAWHGSLDQWLEEFAFNFLKNP